MNSPLALKLAGLAAVGWVGYLVGAGSIPLGNFWEAGSGLTAAAETRADLRRVNTSLGADFDRALLEQNARKRTKVLRRLSREVKKEEFAGFLDRVRKEAGIPAFSALYLEVLEEWATSDPKAALSYVSSLEDQFVESAVAVVIEAWMEIDENAASKWAKALPEGRFRTRVEKAILTSIGMRDINRFMAMIQDGRIEWRPRDDYSLVWSTWLTKDPRAAVEAAMRLSGVPNKIFVFEGIIDIWGQQDSKAAMAWAQQLPEGDIRASAILRILGWLAEVAPQEAVHIASRELSEYRRNEAFEKIVPHWLRMDRAAVLAFVEQLPEGEYRKSALSHCLTHFAKDDPVAAAAWVDKNPSFGRGMVPDIALWWTMLDRHAAMAWVEKLPAGKDKMEAAEVIVLTWARDEPEAALNYVLSSSSESTESNLLSNIFERWQKADFEAVQRWLIRNPSVASGEVVSRLISSIAYNDLDRAFALVPLMPKEGGAYLRTFESLGEGWGRFSPSKGLDQLAKIPEGAPREQFLSGLIDKVASFDPTAASALVMRVSDETQRGLLVPKVASALAQSDPAGALQWTDKVSGGESRDNAIGNVVREWAKADTHEAAKYVNNLPVGSTRDTAMQHFASTMTREDPEGAAIWAASIDDEKKRENSLDDVIRTWKRNDPAAANAWIGASSLPPEWKERMINAK